MAVKVGKPFYISDGVYVHVDEASQIWLRTQRDIGMWHEIALEDQTFLMLLRWACHDAPPVFKTIIQKVAKEHAS